ncbi:hypothetical protein Golob_000574 [Gossypium lobatum]|uniref:DUF4005 domain-containing protein n=1 Tax=Gossypium lobatum TaxID=34289 RepID=A0A7J8N8W1_9ROSI|nr:hypothetical protein [Gossypium lobatum]
MPKVPSYMAPTASAKARLRGQGSPMFTPEAVEKNGLNRRYSLPSSTNSNTSSQSPHGQRRVRVAGKGANISDKSQSSSKDANGKRYTDGDDINEHHSNFHGFKTHATLDLRWVRLKLDEHLQNMLSTVSFKHNMRDDAHWPFYKFPCDMPQLETS